MTEKDYNAIKEYDRIRYEYMLRYEPWMYDIEMERKRWYREYVEEEIKSKEMKKLGLKFPVII